MERKVARHRCLQRQQHERGLFGAQAHSGDLIMVRDDLFGQNQIGLQQSLGGPFHRDAGHAAHLSQLRC